MNMRKPWPLAAVLLAALCGCANIARVESLPRAAADVRFDDIAKAGARQDGGWNLQTDYEHYFEVDGTAVDSVHAAVLEALKRSRYTVVRDDKAAGVVQGERGLTMGEWNAVAGVYWRQAAGLVQVYVRTEITQDVLGSWRENRAKAIADLLCTELLRCKVRISFSDKPA